MGTSGTKMKKIYFFLGMFHSFQEFLSFLKRELCREKNEAMTQFCLVWAINIATVQSNKDDGFYLLLVVKPSAGKWSWTTTSGEKCHDIMENKLQCQRKKTASARPEYKTHTQQHGSGWCEFEPCWIPEGNSIYMHGVTGLISHKNSTQTFNTLVVRSRESWRPCRRRRNRSSMARY